MEIYYCISFQIQIIASASPANNGGGLSQLGGNLRRLVEIFQLALLCQPALPTMGEDQASWAETSDAWSIFLLSFIQAG